MNWGEEYAKRIKATERASPLGDDVFGDKVNLFNGTLSFSATDISLRGNSGLPVELVRSFDTQDLSSSRPIGAWDIETPHLISTHPDRPSVGHWAPAARCSTVEAPPSHSASSYVFSARDYWSGTQLRGAGGGGDLLAFTTDPKLVRPTIPETFKWATKDGWFLSCLPMLQSGHPGEGFLAHAPDGTKYYFNWMVVRSYPGISKKDPSKLEGVLINRKSVRLYATRVEDRFGNWVRYEWNGDRLARIYANDGREITLSYAANGGLISAGATGRTWTYEYLSPDNLSLSAVVNPDGSRWSYARSGGSITRIPYTPNPHGPPQPQYVIEHPAACVAVSAIQEQATPGTFVVTHPSGARAEYTLRPVRHGRTNVPYDCVEGTDDDWRSDYNNYAVFHDVMSLKSKRVTGVGMVAGTYNYDYAGLEGGFAPIDAYTDALTLATPPPHYKYVTVTEPDGTLQVNTFGKDYGLNEGQLLRTETRKTGVTYRTTTNSYVTGDEVATMPFPGTVGDNLVAFGDAFSAAAIRPVKTTTITQDGSTFNSQVNAFDSSARPLSVRKFSSLGYSKTDVTEYYDDTAKWVLGQVKRQYNADTGIVTSQTDYDPATALPIRNYSFGKLQNTLGYNGDGTLRTVTDGRGNTSTLSDWKRGIPQHILHPDNTSETARVNDNGWITAVADENYFWTGYGYDAMGRMASVVHPTTDARAWNIERSEFRAVTADEWKPDGIAVGQWRQLNSTGNHRKVTYFDAMWRPVLQHEYDDANNPATIRSSSTAYDISGRKAFQSYPANAVIPGTAGTRTFYDALDRPIRVEQDSGADVLTSHTRYLTGDFATHTINPNGVTTYTAYQAFDQPDMSAPVGISTAGGMSVTDISRHPQLGRVNAITKRNASGTLAATRRYVYDGNGQLCKTIEPETGATVIAYDGAGNVSWSAAGLTLPSTGDCDHDAAYASGRRVTRDYDERNRLTSLNFPDGNGDQNWKYTADGLPEQIITYNDGGTTAVVNAYSYNQRRLLTGESSSQPNWYGWGIGYGYDANGNLATQSYPSGMTVDFAPNALGQPTRAGDSATGVSYYPNGAIKQFTYGNGLVHSMTQNARQLPSRVSAGGNAMDFEYGFDPNGNVTHIYDHVAGTPTAQHRYMEYDALDRLTGTGSQMFGGDHWHRYKYDALDNMTSSTLAGVKEHNYDYDSNNRLSMVRNNAGAATIALGYDVQGNLSFKNAQDYSFDYGNRLRAVNGKETYRYDGQGRRVQAVATGKGSILSMYSQSGQVVYQHNDRESKGVDHVYLGGSLIATMDRMWATGTTVTKYHHTDALGSPVATTDSGGQVVDRTKYEPYGAAIGKTVDGVGYTGHVMDGETGLTYMQQRYYDPQLGRFLSVDPVTANSSTGANFNRYKYASNNPYRFTDPDGRKDEEWLKNSSLAKHASNLSGIGAVTSAHSVGSYGGSTAAASGGSKAFGPLRSGYVPAVSNPTQPKTPEPRPRSDGTVQIGLKLSGTLGPVSLAVSAGLAGDSQGGLALYSESASGAGTRGDAYAGFTMHWTNAKSVNDLAGQSYAGSAGGGFGPYVSGDASYSPTPDGRSIYGGGFTIGAGAGGGGSGEVTQTTLYPIGN